MNESRLVYDVMQALGKHGAVYRCNAGAIRLPNGKTFRGMPKGFSDIMLEASLRKALADRKIKRDFFEEKISRYMELYDAHQFIQSKLQRIISGEVSFSKSHRAFIDLSAEQRRINSQMMDILKFLGIKPPEDKLGLVNSDDDEL